MKHIVSEMSSKKAGNWAKVAAPYQNQLQSFELTVELKGSTY